MYIEELLYLRHVCSSSAYRFFATVANIMVIVITIIVVIATVVIVVVLVTLYLTPMNRSDKSESYAYCATQCFELLALNVPEVLSPFLQDLNEILKDECKGMIMTYKV